MPQSITISVTGGYIEVRSPYEMKDILKSIPTARWSKPKKCWRYPAAPDTAKRILSDIEKANYQTDFPFDVLLKPDDEEYNSLLYESEMRSIIERNGAPNAEARGLKTKFWSHQQKAFNMAMALRFNMLAMDMGTGKTLVALAVMENTNTQFTLIFCPRYVVPVWAAETEKHLENPPAQILELGSEFGPIAKRLERLKLGREWCQNHGEKLLAIINYDAVASSRGKGGKTSARKLQDYLLSEQWDFTILDESQRIKAPGGATSKFMGQLRDRARRRICMTGTPFHSTPLDIYAQMRFLSPDIYGTSFAKFKQRYAEENHWGGVDRIINEDELHQKFYRLAYRVKADDVLDLPESTEVIRKCTLEPKARIAYGEIEQHAITFIKSHDIDKMNAVVAANGAVKAMRLIQLTGGWMKDENGQEHRVSTAKASLLGEVLDDLPLREPVIVLCYYYKDMDAIKKVCDDQGRTVAELSGRIKKEGMEKIEEWKTGKRDVLITQVNSGSVGINWMVRARIAIIYSLGHISHGTWDQAQRRLVRKGQTRPVQFIHLHATATRDASVLNALRRKIDVVKYILDEMRGEK